MPILWLCTMLLQCIWIHYQRRLYHTSNNRPAQAFLHIQTTGTHSVKLTYSTVFFSPEKKRWDRNSVLWLYKWSEFPQLESRQADDSWNFKGEDGKDLTIVFNHKRISSTIALIIMHISDHKQRNKSSMYWASKRGEITALLKARNFSLTN